ncbi:hypothetical protein Hte_009940 [Hypoxylon texense]
MDFTYETTFAEYIGLRWPTEKRDAYLKQLNTIYLPRVRLLKSEGSGYPRVGQYVPATRGAHLDWEAYWEIICVKRREYYHGLRPEIDGGSISWERVIKPDESVIIRDRDTGNIVLVVIRELCPDTQILGTMATTCERLIQSRKPDRWDDPGKLVHFGYTTGSNTHPQIQLSAPMKGLDTSEKRRQDRRLLRQAQGMSGLLWNMLHSRLPGEIIGDFNDTILKDRLPRMDMRRRDKDTFSFACTDRRYTFRTDRGSDLEQAPPSGLERVGDSLYYLCT